MEPKRKIGTVIKGLVNNTKRVYAEQKAISI